MLVVRGMNYWILLCIGMQKLRVMGLPGGSSVRDEILGGWDSN